MHQNYTGETDDVAPPFPILSNRYGAVFGCYNAFYKNSIGLLNRVTVAKTRRPPVLQ